MSIFQDLLKMGRDGVPIDRVKVTSRVNLERVGDRWILVEEEADSVVSAMGISRSVDIEPRPFIDNVEYTFGVSVSEVKDKSRPKGSPKVYTVCAGNDKVAKRHEAYIKSIADKNLADPDVKALLDFLSDDPYGKLTEGLSEPAVAEINRVLFSGQGAIRVVAGGNALSEKYASQFSVYKEETIRCSLTGEIATKTDMKPEKLSGIYGGTTAGVVTISCNTREFPVVANYNFEKNDGTPISTAAYVTITRNMQKLLSNRKTYRAIPNSNVSYILRYDNVEESLQGIAGALINTPQSKADLVAFGYDPEDPSDDTDTSVVYKRKKDTPDSIVYKKYMSVRRGTVVNAKLSGSVTIYRINCVQGRWSCTDTYTVDLARMFDNIDTWYKDTLTAGVPHSVYWLLRSSLPEYGKIDPREYENLVQAIIRGTEIKGIILKRVLHRISVAHKGVSMCQYALIRACYNSMARHHNLKELSDMLDNENKSYSYNLGRLLAIGDYIQSKANPNIGTPLSANQDRLALQRPTECKAFILRRIEIYKRQLSARGEKGIAIFITRRMEDVVTNLNVVHDQPLTINEQAEMRTAFVQQTNDFYKKTTTTEE